MKKRFLLSVLAIVFLGACSKSETSGRSAAEEAEHAEPVITVDGLTTVRMWGDDRMKFNIEAFTVQSGDTLRLIFENRGKMPKASMGHNVVFLQAAADPNTFVTAAARARATDYIPAEKAGEILAHTALLGPGERDMIEFIVPEAGAYHFICSFPAHLYAGMRGVMTVE